MAGIQSNDNNFVTPSNSTTSSNASPKTGEGFVSGKRSVAMMSSKNGSTTEHAGNSAATSAGLPRSSPKRKPVLKTSGEYLRTSQTRSRPGKNRERAEQEKRAGHSREVFGNFENQSARRAQREQEHDYHRHEGLRDHRETNREDIHQ